jgi:RNA-directed DNA polymerase
MLSARTGEKLRAISDVARKGRRVKDLRRLMNHPDLWMEAYLHIQGNKGALTRGTTATTMDGYSPERAANLVELIRARRYKPNPVRRVVIPKRTPGKTRPLGIPSADDKLVQEVVRMILERIYEPLFSDSSHGFRPKRSCHTALQSIKDRWNGVKWFIDIDIQGYYDNINHEILMDLLKKKIEDTQFLDLIRDMLKAGYVEDWQFHKTYSGTAQGGIISPILANIYLHEFDQFMEQKKQEFDQGKARKVGVEWRRIGHNLQYQRRQVKALKGENTPETHAKIVRHEQKIRELALRQKRLPATDPLDAQYKRLFYARYADDFLIGIIGSKHDAEQVLHTAHCFLDTKLHLAISEEKSGIHHAKEGTSFLGYVVQNYTSEKLLKIHRKDTKVVATCRTMHEHIQLRIPYLKLSEFCQRKGYGIYDTARASQKPFWLTMDDEEILLAYNAEMRGIANYYALATGAKTSLKKLIYIAETSFLKTLAGKHQSSVNKMAAKHRHGRDLVVTTTTKEGKQRRYTLFKLRSWAPPQPKDDVDTLPILGTFLRASRNSLQQRLEANVCEFCGREGGYFEVHHVRKLKDVKGKARWEQIMIARQRKTMILCNACHDLLHAGKLSKRQKKV